MNKKVRKIVRQNRSPSPRLISLNAYTPLPNRDSSPFSQTLKRPVLSTTPVPRYATPQLLPVMRKTTIKPQQTVKPQKRTTLSRSGYEFTKRKGDSRIQSISISTKATKSGEHTNFQWVLDQLNYRTIQSKDLKISTKADFEDLNAIQTPSTINERIQVTNVDCYNQNFNSTLDEFQMGTLGPLELVKPTAKKPNMRYPQDAPREIIAILPKTEGLSDSGKIIPYWSAESPKNERHQRSESLPEQDLETLQPSIALPSLANANQHQPLTEARRALSTYKQKDFLRPNKQFRQKKTKKRKATTPMRIN